jgi:hypothetical protein
MSLLTGHLFAVREWKIFALVIYALVGTTGTLVIHTALGSPYLNSLQWSFILVTPLLGVFACALAVLCDAAVAILCPRRQRSILATNYGSSHLEEQAASDACHGARQVDV